MIMHKVAAFITRGQGQTQELLVIDHPDAGIQLPAGTVEPAETPDTAVLREVREEAGLTAVSLITKLASFNQLQGDQRVMGETTAIKAGPEPDAAYLDISFRRGWTVREIQRQEQMVHICYEEYEFHNNLPGKAILVRKGWVPATAVTDQLKRHLYHLRPTRPLPAEWRADPGDHGHAPWRLFWLPLASAQLVQGQHEWLDRFRAELLDFLD